MPTTSDPSRTHLQFAASVVTVAVAFYARIELVVPFLLAWAIWGLTQRSRVPERRWISVPFAASAAYLIWYSVGGLLKIHSVGLIELFILGLPLVWLFFRPGRASILFVLAVQSVFGCLMIRYLVEVFLHPEAQAAGLRGVVAALYFCVVTLGASILALRRQPDVFVVGEAAG